jgi:protocatechuate 3,4-dioxygenase beta subunit
MRSFIVLLLLGGSALAQDLQTGAIGGTITDDTTGQPVPLAAVTCGRERAVTDEQGWYRITALVPGRYDCFIERADLNTFRREVRVSVDHAPT